MASHDLEQELGELSGHLQALIPTLERMEERLHLAMIKAAEAEGRNQGTRKDLDELKQKISLRLEGMYKRFEAIEGENNNRKNEIALCKRDISDAVEDACGPMAIRLKELETAQAAMKVSSEGWKNKTWDMVKIVVAAGIGALVAWFFK